MRLTITLLLALALSPISGATSLSRCVTLTFYDGKQSEGRSVKGILYPEENKLIYDWKNGVMDFLWSLPDGAKGGEPDGFEGTYKEDGGRGKFSVRENRKTQAFEGTYTARGRNQKNRLVIAYCQ